MAFPMVQGGMWPDSTEVEFQLGLVAPGTVSYTHLTLPTIYSV